MYPVDAPLLILLCRYIEYIRDYYTLLLANIISHSKIARSTLTVGVESTNYVVGYVFVLYEKL